MKAEGRALRAGVALALIGGFVLPILAGFAQTAAAAFGHLPAIGAVNWSLAPWHELMALPGFGTSLRLTLVTGLGSTLLALMLATARAQLGDPQGQRDWALKAKDWGCPPRLMAQVLASGVHNSLGRAAAVVGRQEQAITHFERAIQMGAPGSDMRHGRPSSWPVSSTW